MERDRIDVRVAADAGRWPLAVAVTAVGLLLRRYLGTAESTLVADGAAVVLDLGADGPVVDRVDEVDRALRAAPVVPPAGEPEVFRVTWADGRSCTVHAPSPSAEVPFAAGPHLRACLREDLGTIAAVLTDAVATGDTALTTADVLVAPAYERRWPEDRPDRHRPSAAVAGPDGATIPAAFARQVLRGPDRPAVLAADGRLTYRELAAAAVAVAAGLPARDDAGPGRVGVFCRHGASTVTAILATLAAGHAYVPLDPSFPAERLAEILADCGARAVVTDREHAERAARLAGGVPVVVVEDHRPTGEAPEALAAALAGPARHDDPAYLLYTSGSTGRPKGVVQSHGNVLFGVGNHAANFRLTPDDRTSVLTSFGFDMAVTDTFSALLTGAAAVPVDVRAAGLAGVIAAITEHGVTVYHSTPTVYRYLVAALGHDRLPTVRAALLGGEEVSWRDVAAGRTVFGADCVFVNGYGTTEVSFVAQHHLGPGDPVGPGGAAGVRVPVGRPLAGIAVDLVDGAGRPTCLHGEMVVRSQHLALGYWGRPDLTAERFVERGGQRAYRTGDLARRLPDGRLVYTGRADRQVKVRGFRVEPGEIEARLAARSDVAHVAVAPRRARADDATELVAFVVPAAGATIEAESLREALGRELPDYLVPRTVVPLADPPLTSTGKLDVRALLDSLAADQPGVPADTPAAAGGLDELITEAWREVLGVPSVGPDDRFFDLGGHSLMMALVHRRLESALGRRIPIGLLFRHPTVRQLARQLAGGEAAADGPGPAGVSDRMARRRAARTGRRSAP